MHYIINAGRCETAYSRPSAVCKKNGDRKNPHDSERKRKMFENGLRYNGIGPWLKDFFGQRTVKISVDGGFTCPNRDGTLGYGGCIFCSELGSGDFSGTRILSPAASFSPENRRPAQPPAGPLTGISPSPRAFSLRPVPPIRQQIDAQIEALRKKWHDFRCIIYFQNFTNTYAPVSVLKKKYEEALLHPMCCGLAIATRPDCLDDEIVSYLSELNSRTFLWVELGLQTSNEKTARYIRRGYPLQTYDDAVSRLSDEKIRVVTHLIAGLPGETGEDFIQSAVHASSGKIFGLKLQLLHIMKNTDLAEQWLSETKNPADKHPFPLCPLTKEEYICRIADALERIPENITIHRLTGDAPRPLLLAPRWSLDKRSALNGINQELKRRGSYQGVLFHA